MSDFPPGAAPAAEADMPMTDLRHAYWHQDAFYADPMIGFDAQTMPLRLALMLTPLDPELPQHHLGGQAGYWTFFGGTPSRPVNSELEWPTDADDQPLAHILQVDLLGASQDQGSEAVSASGLPTSGLLQFFHDCATYGNDLTESGAWAVRLVATEAATDGATRDSGWEQTPAPEEPSDRLGRLVGPPVPLAHEVAPSIPNTAGLDTLPADEMERYFRVWEWIEEHPYDRNLARRDEHFNPLTPWDEDFTPLPAPTRLLGCSAVPANEDYDQLVRDNLPLAGDDKHVLLADINVDQFSEADPDWFHGGRHVEFWIRDSDLTAHRFDRTWALIRTDH